MTFFTSSTAGLCLREYLVLPFLAVTSTSLRVVPRGTIFTVTRF